MPEYHSPASREHYMYRITCGGMEAFATDGIWLDHYVKDLRSRNIEASQFTIDVLPEWWTRSEVALGESVPDKPK